MGFRVYIGDNYRGSYESTKRTIKDCCPFKECIISFYVY